MGGLCHSDLDLGKTVNVSEKCRIINTLARPLSLIEKCPSYYYLISFLVLLANDWSCHQYVGDVVFVSRFIYRHFCGSLSCAAFIYVNFFNDGHAKRSTYFRIVRASFVLFERDKAQSNRRIDFFHIIFRQLMLTVLPFVYLTDSFDVNCLKIWKITMILFLILLKTFWTFHITIDKMQSIHLK